MKFITTNEFTPEAFAGQLAQVIADPGAFLPRIRHSESDYEPLHAWQARAVISMFQPIEASDGSAQPVDPSVLVSLVAVAKETHPRINPNSSPAECRERDELIRRAESARGVSEFRALLDSAKGVTADQLELTLARGHLKEAARICTELKQENDRLRGYLRIAGDLLGRADADPIKIAEKVEAGIIDLNAKCEGQAKEIELAATRYDGERKNSTMIREERDRCRAAYAAERERAVDLQSEADKARRVIAGNTDIEDSGSLLDMLNAILQRLALAEDAASKGEKARLAAGGMEEEITRLREKEALHTESNGMLSQERDRAKTGLEHTQAALAGLVKIIDKAGLLNLSNGVEIGTTVWYVKAKYALDFARTQLPKCSKCGTPCVPCSDGLCDNCTPF